MAWPITVRELDADSDDFLEQSGLARQKHAGLREGRLGAILVQDAMWLSNAGVALGKHLHGVRIEHLAAQDAFMIYAYSDLFQPRAPGQVIPYYDVLVTEKPSDNGDERLYLFQAIQRTDRPLYGW